LAALALSSLKKMLEKAIQSNCFENSGWDYGNIEWDEGAIGAYWGPRRSTTKNKDWHYWCGLYDDMQEFALSRPIILIAGHWRMMDGARRLKARLRCGTTTSI
jgi:hypothetical protein